MSYGRRECAPIEYADRVVLLHTARGGEATIFRNGDVRTPDNADEKETKETKEKIVAQAAVTPPRRGLRGAKHGLSRGSEVKGITRFKEADKKTTTYAIDLYKKMALRQAHAVV